MCSRGIYIYICVCVCVRVSVCVNVYLLAYNFFNFVGEYQYVFVTAIGQRVSAEAWYFHIRPWKHVICGDIVDLAIDYAFTLTLRQIVAILLPDIGFWWAANDGNATERVNILWTIDPKQQQKIHTHNR